MKKKILIFIISYKASYRIYEVYNKIPFKKLYNFNFKILLSDDCSNDDTINYIYKIKNKKTLVNINKKNLGYGAHIKKCLNYAINNSFSYAVIIHGDGQYSPVYIPSLLKKFDNERNIVAVTGSRFLNGFKNAMKGNMPVYKLLGNIVLTKFYNFLFKTKFSDCHTGMWAYNLDLLKKKKFNLLCNDFNFDQEFRYFCNHNQKHIKEIYIKTRYSDERSQLHIIYALKFFFKSFLFLLIKKKIIISKKFL